MKRNSIDTLSQIDRFLCGLCQSARTPRINPQLRSIDALATAAAVSEQTVYRWLRGDQSPTSANWHLLRHAAYGRTLPASWSGFRFVEDVLFFGDGVDTACSASAVEVRRWLLGFETDHSTGVKARIDYTQRARLPKPKDMQ